jgi:anti-sigma regulatory factor (Ser/Thr protein kinase)
LLDIYCVLHAYGCDRTSSTYMLETRIEDHALVVIVHDYGVGIGMAPNRSVGIGFGLRLIKELADSADVSSRPAMVRASRCASWRRCEGSPLATVTSPRSVPV